MKKNYLIFIFFLIGVFIWSEIYLPESYEGWRRDLSLRLPKNFQLGEEKLFSVEKGQGLFQISKNLEKEGLIKNRFFFIFYVVLKGKERNLQAEKYYLSPSESIAKIAKKIISGDIAKIIVTIPEGFTVKEIEEKLGMKLPGENLEGFLFPDTYEFPIDVIGKEVVEKMRENFEKKLTPELSGEIQSQGKTIFEVITMASLLEKEVSKNDDKELVSGILWKRLENGMPLQVDATITYIKKTTNPEGVASRPYGARISIEETQIDSLYNTYKYLGLPPGPICNPGIDSIKAAIYPKNSQYWYYLSTPEGKTIFSKTLEEHNLAKAKYLK